MKVMAILWLVYFGMIRGLTSRRLLESYRFQPNRLFVTQATRYTIDCPPTSPDVLQETVSKHVETFDRYLSNRPMSLHTKAAYEELCTHISPDTPIILDSGCGTGRSSLHLGQLYPQHNILGIDRSLVRLLRNQHYDESTNLVQQAAPNVYLMRAELVDAWRLLLEDCWQVDHHYLLYPNPYPKPSRWKNRWYGHASLPLLLSWKNAPLTIRSNWRLYLEEFRQASHLVDEKWQGDVQTVSYQPAWTQFEEKYQAVGEPTYELELKRKES